MSEATSDSTSTEEKTLIEKPKEERRAWSSDIEY